MKCEICENSVFQTGMIDRLGDELIYYMDFVFVQIIYVNKSNVEKPEAKAALQNMCMFLFPQRIVFELRMQDQAF